MLSTWSSDGTQQPGLLMLMCCLVRQINSLLSKPLFVDVTGSSQARAIPVHRSTFSPELDSSYLPTQREFGLSTLTEILPDGLDGLSLNEVRYLEPRLLLLKDHSRVPQDATSVYLHAFSFSLGTCFFSSWSEKIILSLPPSTVNIKFNPRLF